MFIEARGLTVSRLGRRVLRDVSVGIPEGACVSIVGPNGAGKSTLMMALAGLLPVDGGEVRLGGRVIQSLRRREIARQLAYVPQLHDGYTGFLVRDVIEAGRYAHVGPLDPLGDADRAAVDEAVSACRLSGLLDRTVDTLSGGEQQKVWIAAALAQQSPALLLDEPTNSLDPAHEAELIGIMRRFSAGGGTLVVICHDLNLALSLGGRVIALREGAVLFDESAKAVLEPARLADLFGVGFAVHHDAAGTAASIHLDL